MVIHSKFLFCLSFAYQAGYVKQSQKKYSGVENKYSNGTYTQLTREQLVKKKTKIDQLFFNKFCTILNIIW